jgi:hypothetical protein
MYYASILSNIGDESDSATLSFNGKPQASASIPEGCRLRLAVKRIRSKAVAYGLPLNELRQINP